jgi:hypothetical protein
MHRFFAIPLFFLLGAPLLAQSDLAFPQVAVGGSPAYETVLQIINEVETDNPVVIEVFQGFMAGSANGTPLSVRFDGGTPAVSRTVTLTPFQEFTTILTSSGTTLMNGWLRVRSTIAGGKISGNVVFRQRNSGGLIDSVGATSPQRYRQAVIQVDQRETGSDTGVACANPDNTAVVVTVEVYQGLNLAASPLPVTLQPQQHYARLVTEMFPAFGSQQGTLIISAAANRQVPCMALRMDNFHLTSIPVRPLGFSFQYSVINDAGAPVEAGFWLFDLSGFTLIGTGKIESPVAAELPEVTGSWMGTNFQFRYRKAFADGTVGMVVFNGTSAGQESLSGSDGRSKLISGKVTTIGADGRVISINTFAAYHKFGALPQ